MTDSSLSGLELGAYETSHFGRFLSERPVEDPYGVIETPRNSGPIPQQASDPGHLWNDRDTISEEPDSGMQLMGSTTIS